MTINITHYSRDCGKVDVLLAEDVGTFRKKRRPPEKAKEYALGRGETSEKRKRDE